MQIRKVNGDKHGPDPFKMAFRIYDLPGDGIHTGGSALHKVSQGHMGGGREQSRLPPLVFLRFDTGQILRRKIAAMIVRVGPCLIPCGIDQLSISVDIDNAEQIRAAAEAGQENIFQQLCIAALFRRRGILAAVF